MWDDFCRCRSANPQVCWINLAQIKVLLSHIGGCSSCCGQELPPSDSGRTGAQEAHGRCRPDAGRWTVSPRQGCGACPLSITPNAWHLPALTVTGRRHRGVHPAYLTSSYPISSNALPAYRRSHYLADPANVVAQNSAVSSRVRQASFPGASSEVTTTSAAGLRALHRPFSRLEPVHLSTMVLNETRRRLLRQLNTRYIYGRYVRPTATHTPRDCLRDEKHGGAQ